MSLRRPSNQGVPAQTSPLSIELQTFVDRVIVPALLERFLRERTAHSASVHAVDLPKTEATV
jgi:hypothetical protein